MKYDFTTYQALQYPLIKDYIDSIYSNGTRLDFPDDYLYPMRLDDTVSPDTVIRYHRKFISFLAICVVYRLLPDDLRRLFWLKFVKKESKTKITMQLSYSEQNITIKTNDILRKIIDAMNFRVVEDDVLDARLLINIIHLLDIRISIFVRYRKTELEHYRYLVKLRTLYMQLYLSYVDIYNTPNDSVEAIVVMIKDFNPDISVKFLSKKLNYSCSKIYQSLDVAKKIVLENVRYSRMPIMGILKKR